MENFRTKITLIEVRGPRGKKKSWAELKDEAELALDDLQIRIDFEGTGWQTNVDFSHVTHDKNGDPDGGVVIVMADPPGTIWQRLDN